MRKSNPMRRHRLEPVVIRRILRSAARRGVAAVSFTGGEPLLHIGDLTRLIQYAGDVGIPYIRTGTNGFHFSGYRRPGFSRRVGRLARALAATPVRNFWISIDSVDGDVHDRMRGFKDLMAGIRKALPIFHAEGLYPSANLGLNRNLGGAMTSRLNSAHFSSRAAYAEAFHTTFKTALSRFYQRVIDLGFTIVNTCYPMSVSSPADQNDLQAVYAATSVDRVVQFTSMEKQLLFKALLNTIPKFRSQIRVFTPLCALYNLTRQHSGRPHMSYPCRGGRDFFFVDAAEGNTYPCGYRGSENLGKFWSFPGEMAAAATCRQCDWECFRDPSELMGPLLEDIRRPLQTLRAVPRHWDFFKHWATDLAYYRACDLFDGRRPPDYRRMAHFNDRKRKKKRPAPSGRQFIENTTIIG
jgi:MoaA/NifB/PqqE/SkfB family radical SAM enzyme